jgi:glycosyltransferase involved in cell wall biosynthesis
VTKFLSSTASLLSYPPGERRHGNVGLTVVIPAYNEERCLPETLHRISGALGRLQQASEVIVVDNGSDDRTRDVAEVCGARVVSHADHNISAVRNAGAHAATGDVLVFIDADTLVPDCVFENIARVMRDERCLGGAVSVRYQPPARRWMKLYLAGWRFWSRLFNMKQGAAQFCRRPAFEALGGYDETIFVGEDIEFYWRLARFARNRGEHLRFIENPPVITSARRFDAMSVWRTIVLTHPVFIRLAWRRRGIWSDWYQRPPR